MQTGIFGFTLTSVDQHLGTPMHWFFIIMTQAKPALRTALLYFQNKTTAYFCFIYILVCFKQHKNLTKVKNKCHKNIKTYTQKLQQNEITAGHHCAILQNSLSCLFGTDTSCNCCNECKYESQFCVWCKACTVLTETLVT